MIVSPLDAITTSMCVLKELRRGISNLGLIVFNGTDPDCNAREDCSLIDGLAIVKHTKWHLHVPGKRAFLTFALKSPFTR